MRLNLANLYNFNMNSVDRADQLRNNYRPDGLWVHQRKWWWSIFLWCLGQAVVNAYILYKRTCEIEKRTPMSHLDFHIAVAEAWCRTPILVTDPNTARPHQRPAAAIAGSSFATPSATATMPVDSSDGAKKRAPKLTPEYLEKCAASFALNAGPHQVALLDPNKSTKNCQLCVNGYGHQGAERHQNDAHLRCARCGVQVCGAWCWMNLHGAH